MEGETNSVLVGEKKEADENIFVDECGEILGDHLEAVLESWCGIKDAKFLYVKQVGNHLEVGKATINCFR